MSEEMEVLEEGSGAGGASNATTNATTSTNGYNLMQQEEIARRLAECEALHATLPTPEPSLGPYCPRVFDGWSCWNDTPANTTAKASCPGFILGFEPHLTAHRQCMGDGSWFVDPRSNKGWSNYTTCVDLSRLQLHQDVVTLYITGYSISLLALCVSLFIFCFFKSLQCKRVTIHKHFFLSFIINNSMWLVWFLSVVKEPAVLKANGVSCQILHVVLHYFMVSNYFWMFCEGLYLHTLLAVAFVAEDRIMKWFYCVGWGTPLLLTLIYAIARGCDADDAVRVHCWMEDGHYNYILTIPVVVSMAVNLMFLINIVRVLVTKLRAVNTAPDTHYTRKAVRATLILIPLLGLYYLLLPFRPPEGSAGADVFLFLVAVCASFQGLGVSMLFCFFNGEVLSIFKKKLHQQRLMRGATSYANTTLSEIE